MKKRVHVFFSGKVQGVWFRRNAGNFAEEIGGISGWVKNLDDGRVELVAEGRLPGLEELLGMLQMKFEITQKEIEILPYQGEFANFLIKE